MPHVDGKRTPPPPPGWCQRNNCGRLEHDDPGHEGSGHWPCRSCTCDPYSRTLDASCSCRCHQTYRFLHHLPEPVTT